VQVISLGQTSMQICLSFKLVLRISKRILKPLTDIRWFSWVPPGIFQDNSSSCAHNSLLPQLLYTNYFQFARCCVLIVLTVSLNNQIEQPSIWLRLPWGTCSVVNWTTNNKSCPSLIFRRTVAEIHGIMTTYFWWQMGGSQVFVTEAAAHLNHFPCLNLSPQGVPSTRQVVG
jgi:hypothetical protein